MVKTRLLYSLPILPLVVAQLSSLSNNSSSPTSTLLSSASSLSASSTLPANATSVASKTQATSSASGSFTPYPVPSDVPEPGYPSTDPSNPPDIGSGIIPDFGAAWATAWQKAQGAIAGFTLEQKVNITTGVGWAGGPCVGNIPPVGDWPGLCLEDSPLGVRGADYTTGFPAGINGASSFNRSLIRQRGLYMGREHVGKGVNIALGPMMNMGRVAQGGRNWEGFGADPFLTGEAAYETILGLQSGGVIACAKHLVGNEQEYMRTQESSVIDDRTLHEVYTHPFLKSVMAGVGAMMCSYNLLNGTYACSNDRVMNQIVKKEYGYQGFIMSDWSAQHDTISAVRGLDMTMPGDITFGSGTSYFGGNLTAYVQNGTISESRVDDMATRILAAWYLLGQDSASYPKTSFSFFEPWSDQLNGHIDVQDNHYELVRELGAASTILLKNTNNALPLGAHGDKPAERNIALFGSDAGPSRSGPNEYSDQGGEITGTLAMGWGSGTANFTYLVNPLQAIQARARNDRTSVFWLLDDYDLGSAAAIAPQKSAALVFIKADSGEQYITVDGNQGDRKNLTAWANGDNLVQTVAANNNNTIVIVHSVGPLILEPWIDNPNVTAVLWSSLPGQESGNSLVDVLYGDWNPTGRLPYTLAKDINDYPAGLTLGGNPNDPNSLIEVDYTEGLFIDYRHFDAKNITPRFEFGFGLSYTQFTYSNLQVQKLAVSVQNRQYGGDGGDGGYGGGDGGYGGGNGTNGGTDGGDGDAAFIAAWEGGNSTPSVEGISRAFWLHQPAYEATFSVQNTGPVSGGEIPQLYINFPASANEPPSVLRGFTDVLLDAGESQSVSITLSRYDLSIWNVVDQGWQKPDGDIGVWVGASSRDKRLTGTVTI